jgi:hypothetical protein
MKAILTVDGAYFIKRRKCVAPFVRSGCLRRLRAKGDSIADTDPRGWPYRRLKATLRGIVPVGNALEDEDIFIDEAAHRSRVCRSDGSLTSYELILCPEVARPDG